MAYIKLYRDKLKHNYEFLNIAFQKRGIEWAIVTKLLCGNQEYLNEVIKLGIKEVCDSRISNLRKVKDIDESVQTVYIKPPAKRSISDIVRYADASFNSEYETIKMLSAEAVRQDKLHKVIIMIELGDLREGVMGDKVVDFYAAVFKLPKIKITGIGANLNCLHGVMPSEDKLVQLSLYKQLIEAKFDREIPWVTGGTSVVFPFILQNRLPKAINHFRMGETLYFGNNLLDESPIPEMEQGVIKLFTEIIELIEKPVVPIGSMQANVAGEETEINEEDYGKKSFRAIIDVGLLDISPDYIIPDDSALRVTNASSDMLILDLGENENNYKVGDLISFKLKYMGALSLLNSTYIEKIIV